jgi:UTP-glucose-1-phosphate uridylyltransferase
VHDLDGNPTIIDINGRDWCSSTPMIEGKLIEALVPHKGIALVRDEGGWFYMNQAGQEVNGGERYLFAEPHYNGQARVRFLNGQWGVVDEAGKVVLSLGESMLSSALELEYISKRYWESLALKKILENNVLQDEHLKNMPSACATFREILKDCSIEMGLLRREQPSGVASNPASQLLNRGRLLTAASRADGTAGVSSITEERCRYWLQDRYLQAWFDCSGERLNRDTFAELAADPTLVEQSQRILKSYADADWKGAGTVLSRLLHGQSKDSNDAGGAKTIRTIVDMGGGHGSLLRELQGSELLKDTEEFICIDRPEVVAAAASAQGSTSSSFPYANQDTEQRINNGHVIKHEVGGLFDGPLRKADLYLMSRVLHDWPGPQAAAILDRLYAMSPEDSRLCVIDRVSMPDKLHALLSLHMFALQGSRERTHEQWQDIFASSGWQIDGREHIKGHEMYMLRKKIMASKSENADSSNTGNNFPGSEEFVEAAAATPTIRKAVIAAGGLGTRMAPQTVITPKALLPIISPERLEVRPALSYILDQFYETCHTVDQVYVVSNPQHIPLLESFLQDYHRQQHANGSKEMTLQIVTQNSARGFGDAVLAARQAIGDEPFVLAVGDHIFSVDCVKNVLAGYKEIPFSSGFLDWRNTALTGAALCNESEVKHTGLLSNQQSAYQLGRPWVVHQMVEKPSSNYESFQLSMAGSVKYPSQLVSSLMNKCFS